MRSSSVIDPAKDADGLHPTNLGRLVLNVNSRLGVTPLPCTPRGVIQLLERNDVRSQGQHVVTSSVAASRSAVHSGCC